MATPAASLFIDGGDSDWREIDSGGRSFIVVSGAALIVSR